MRFLSFVLATLFGIPAMADGPKVVTDIPAIHSLAAAIMDGIGEPTLLVPAGGSPHDHALRPSAAQALADTDLVIWIGPALTPWLEDAITTLAPGARSVPLLDQPGTLKLGIRLGATLDEPHDDHHHRHAHTDPHAWLDPQNAAVWARVIAGRLAQADRANVATYRKNRDKTINDLKALETSLSETLKPVQGRKWVALHDAYQYFEHRFGVTAAGAISVSDAAPPSAARVAQIRAFIQDHGAACVFAEPQFGSRMTETVAEGTAAKTGFMDPLGLKLDLGPALYGQLLTRMATDLAACLR